MLQHFAQQFKSAPVLAKADIMELVADDVSVGCGNHEELSEYYTSKIGQRILFYLLWDENKLKYKPIRVFENDIDTVLKSKTFIDMSAATPRFK